MKRNDLNDVTISRFREVFKDSRQIGIGDDFCIIDMKFRKESQTLNYPFRFEGLLLVWCISGHLKISINLNDYDVTEGTLFLCVPGNIFKLKEIAGSSEELHYVCVAMTKEFASSQKVDVQKMFTNGLSLLDDPSVKVSGDEAAMMAEYLDFMGKILDSSMIYRKEALQALWSSMLYVIAGCLNRRTAGAEVSSSVSTSRSRMLFEQFISLVAEYHNAHRNVGFYADKLCLTPKYLSKLIKTATGRSAPEWIDAYVILEAKNLLKYSNDTIKEIVYKLNFPNQSVFYKFFKARTGMTPSEYRNS